MLTPFRPRCAPRFARCRPRLTALERRLAPASYTVLNLADGGPDSLRAAVAAANLNPGADLIDFKSGLAGTITLTTGEIAISQAVTIKGPGPAVLTVSGNNATRVFVTDPAPAAAAIDIAGLTFTKAKGSWYGGAIHGADEAVGLTNCVFTANTTSVAGGAGIAIEFGGTLVATDCTFSNNVAADFAGAIDVFGGAGGKTTLRRCSITGNSGTSAGAIYSSNYLLVEDSTLSGNKATSGSGGAIFFNGAGGLTLRNSTISDNFCFASGGGIVLGSSFSGTVMLQNSTVTANSAKGGLGGGISRLGSLGSIVIESSIVSGNNNPTAPDIFSTGSVTQRTSAVGSGTGFTKTDLGGNLPFQPHGNLMLGGLAANGGPTLTHLPGKFSPLRNAGSNPAGLTHDQRGPAWARAYASPDIGAAEWQDFFFVTNLNDSGVGSLRQAVLTANANPGIDLIQFQGGGVGTVTLTTGEITIADEVIINGVNEALTKIDGNGASRVFNTQPAAKNASINFAFLTITGGKAGYFGGAILGGDEQIVLQSCILTKNQTTLFGGGAVAVEFGGTLRAYDSQFSNNQAANYAGAIDVFGGVTANTELVACNITGNTAQTAGALYATGSLLVANSTFSGNSATFYQAGVMYCNTTLGATIRNSTISGNSSKSTGGGILMGPSFGGMLTVQNSTITGNAAAGGSGGGIARIGLGGYIFIESSIVSGNSNPTAPDILSSGSVSVKTSAVGSGAGFTKTDLGGNLPFQPHFNLLLQGLSFNGGPTQTHRPGPGSPLINAGSNPVPSLNDQRGAGYPRVVDGLADIGAVETTDLLVRNTNDSGPGSLRQCVLDANAIVGSNVVLFDQTFFNSPRTITLTTGQIDISGNVVILSADPTLVTVSGNSMSRHFDMTNGTGVTLAGMTLTGGKPAVSGGGAISINDADVTLDNMILTKNTTDGGFSAGAVAVNAGKLIAVRTVFTDNHVTGPGAQAGAISVSVGASLTLDRCIVSGNSSGEDGGGIYAVGDVTVIDSTISGNASNTTTPGTGGGAIYVRAAALSVTNSTISNNTVTGVGTGAGGGIVLVNFNGNALIRNSTVTQNFADGPFGGGGIARVTGTGSVTIESSIVSGNISGNAPDIASGGLVNVNFSAVGSSLGFTLTGSDNLPFGAALQLGPLASNGGPTKTHALQPGSPAINAGANPAILPNDQRGPGFARAAGGQADIGAFEVQLVPSKVLSVQVNDGTGQRSRVTSLVVTFDQPPLLPPTPANGFQLKRQSDNAAVVLTAGVVGNTVTLTFVGGPVESKSLADGRFTLTVLASQIANLDGDGNGTVGDDYVVVGNPAVAPRLFRLFGDADGDGDVDAQDYGAFRGTFGSASNLAFDFDGDGDVDAADYGAFRGRFGTSV